MPYISSDERLKVDAAIENLLACMEVDVAPFDEGKLNYVITKLLHGAAVDRAHPLCHGKPLRYARINALIGVLECAKMELYRRIAAPYEDQKASINGDVTL